MTIYHAILMQISFKILVVTTSLPLFLYTLLSLLHSVLFPSVVVLSYHFVKTPLWLLYTYDRISFLFGQHVK